jgi:SH3 domain-containing protein
MKIQKIIVFVLVVGAVLLQACGAGTESAIATGIAQTQQISELQTQAAGGGSQPTQESAASATPETSGSTVQVTTVRDINMRSGDSTAYGIMTVIPGNVPVVVIGINQAKTWYQVEYHGAVGWISVMYTTGDVPADMPVATPSAVASGGGGGTGGTGGGGGGGGGGSGNDSFSFTLNLTHDGESKTVQGQLTPGDSDTVTVKFEGLGNNDTGHLRVQLSCSAGEDEVELSESIPRSNHSNECNGDWDYQIEQSDSQLVIGMTLPSNFGGNVDWVMTVEVNN